MRVPETLGKIKNTQDNKPSNHSNHYQYQESEQEKLLEEQQHYCDPTNLQGEVPVLSELD